MNKPILAVLAALSVVALSLGGPMAVAHAQSSPAAPPAPGAPPAAAMPAPDPGAWMRGRELWHQRMANRPFEPGTFALFYRQADRQLTPADVATIAQALLLWNGNHTWKVTNVQPSPDGTVQFSYAAPDNTLIARFAMDTHTGRITRIG